MMERSTLLRYYILLVTFPSTNNRDNTCESQKTVDHKILLYVYLPWREHYKGSGCIHPDTAWSSLNVLFIILIGTIFKRVNYSPRHSWWWTRHCWPGTQLPSILPEADVTCLLCSSWLRRGHGTGQSPQFSPLHSHQPLIHVTKS